MSGNTELTTFMLLFYLAILAVGEVVLIAMAVSSFGPVLGTVLFVAGHAVVVACVWNAERTMPPVVKPAADPPDEVWQIRVTITVMPDDKAPETSQSGKG